MIGDVHGCPDELEALLGACGHDQGDDVVLTGDVIAKGPDSRTVLAMMRELRLRSVCGNHDAHVLRWKAARDAGGPMARFSPTHVKLAESFDVADWSLLQSLPLHLALLEHNALVVHAGLVPGVALAAQDPSLLMNLRSVRADGTGSKRPDEGVAWGSLWHGPELVLFGHHASAGLQEYPFAIGLDTGCVYGGKLSALILPERRLVSVPAKHEYSVIARESAT